MPSIPDRRVLWRIALQFQRQYGKRAAAPMTLPTNWAESWQQIQRRQHQGEWARQHGLVHAAAVSHHRLSRHVQEMLHELKNWQAQLARPRADSVLVRALYDELLSLFDEFPQVAWDLRQKTLSVHTERLELHNIDLGPFEIQLPIRELGSSARYRVIALEPNPCAEDSDTPHPHVHHDGLCEGEGHQAIQQALATGRLLDFFVLIRQVLRTYNPSSAYRSLEDWFGTPCADCGDRVTDDEQCECDRCGCGLCGTCASSCGNCGQTTCADCLSPCAGCSCQRCDSCLASCETCGKSFCEGCLDDSRCSACQPSPSEDDLHDDLDVSALESTRSTLSASTTDTASTEAAIQSHRVGETVVPA